MVGMVSSRCPLALVMGISAIGCLVYITTTDVLNNPMNRHISVFEKIRKGEKSKPRLQEATTVANLASLQYTTRMVETKGKVFEVSSKVPLGSPTHFIKLDVYPMNRFTFVTAAGTYHFNESKDAIGGFQQVFPGHRFIYYDLGLYPKDAETVKSWCNVEYRKLDYAKYPFNVMINNRYAFKSIVIYEVMRDVEAIFWIDASIRPKELNVSKWSAVYDVARMSGIVQFDHSGLSIDHCTHPTMYEYLPADQERLKSLEMLGSGAAFIYRTEQIYKEVVHWHYLCGITADCITPEGHSANCDHTQANVTHCHRYDQSSLDILVANAMGYNRTLYTGPVGFIKVQRHPTHQYEPMICQPE